jgi:isocitrate lyase
MTEHDEMWSELLSGDQSRWSDIKRTYTPGDVLRLRGSLQIEYTIARKGAERLWKLLQTEPYVAALGAVTGNQAIEQVRAGLLSVYASGLQAAADANTAREMYSDQSLYPSDSVPNLVRNINKSLQRADQIHHAEGNSDVHWYAPVVADAAGGCGGRLSTFELMKAMIEAGAAAVQFEDVLPKAKQCGDLQGKVLVSAREFIEKLIAARLAADVMNVPSLLIACTHAEMACLVEADFGAGDRKFIVGKRTPEGYFRFRGGLDAAIGRALAYAPYADVLWCETSAPDLKEAHGFAEAIHGQFPGKLLAYNCSPSFNWVKQLDATTIRNFHVALSGMGYKLQLVTLAGFHSLNLSMFDLARDYRETGMAAYARLQESEFGLAETHGYEAVGHQRFVGTGYFDDVAKTVSGSMQTEKQSDADAQVQQSTSQASLRTASGAAKFSPKPEVAQR